MAWNLRCSSHQPNHNRKTTRPRPTESHNARDSAVTMEIARSGATGPADIRLNTDIVGLSSHGRTSGVHNFLLLTKVRSLTKSHPEQPALKGFPVHHLDHSSIAAGDDPIDDPSLI